MDVKRLLTTTRSARKALDIQAPVDLADIAECLSIALHAANGSNLQPWRWLIVTDRQRRAAVAECYREAYLSMTGGSLVANSIPSDSDFGRLMSSTEWLVEHLAEVPVLVIPCYEPSSPTAQGSEASFYRATL